MKRDARCARWRGMRRLAWLALILVACSTGQTASEASPTPTQAMPPAWSCRLPVISGSAGQGSGPLTPGFLSLPGSSFTPAIAAGDGLYYNRRLARWVAWGPESFSEESSTYAYVEGDQKTSRIHLVDLTATKDTVLAEGGPWRLVGLQRDAAYVMRIDYLPESPAYGVMVAGRGLWKVPLGGGAPVQLTSDSRGWAFVSKGAAWGHSNTLDVAGGPNDVVRLDLKTREQTVWFDVHKRSHVLAIDASGVPLIMSEAASNELWRVPSPDSDVRIWSSKANENGPYAPVAVDGDVVWFSSRSLAREWSIYRYAPPHGVELVASFTDHPVWVAGPCA